MVKEKYWFDEKKIPKQMNQTKTTPNILRSSYICVF